MPAQNLPGLILDRTHLLARGLVGWWPLNEGAGTRANDISGNGYSVTAGTSTPVRTGGSFGAAIGTNHLLTTYLTFPDMRSRLSTEGTFSVWVKRARFPYVDAGEEGAWSFAGTGNACHYPYVEGTIYLGNFATVRKTVGASAVDVTKWHLVTVTSKPGAGGWIFYQNAQMVYSTTGDSTVTIPAAPTLGKSVGAYYLYGNFAHLRLYDRALSAHEIAQLYADPLAGALAPARASRYYSVAVVAPPPTPPTLPMSADRLNNRTYARIFRRGETG